MPLHKERSLHRASGVFGAGPSVPVVDAEDLLVAGRRLPEVREPRNRVQLFDERRDGSHTPTKGKLLPPNATAQMRAAELHSTPKVHERPVICSGLILLMDTPEGWVGACPRR